MTADDDDVFAELAARLEAQPDQLPPRPESVLPGYRVRPHEDHGVAGSLVDRYAALPRRLRGHPRRLLWGLLFLSFAPVLWLGVSSSIGALVHQTPITNTTLLQLLIAFLLFLAMSLLVRRLCPAPAAERLLARIAAERQLARVVDQLPPGQLLPLWDRVLPGTEYRLPLIAVTEHGIHLVTTAVGGPWTRNGRDWINQTGKVLTPELTALADGQQQLLYAVARHPSMAHPRVAGRHVLVYCWVVEVAPAQVLAPPTPGTLPPSIAVPGGRPAVNLCPVAGFGEALENRMAAALSPEEAQLLHHILDELAPHAPYPRS